MPTQKAGTEETSQSQDEFLNQLFSATHDELRKLASTIRRDDANAQVSVQSLINEAWLKLKNSGSVEFKSSVHFKMLAARAMRQILVDAARKRVALKRGGDTTATAISDVDSAAAVPGEKELIALRDSLNELSRLNPRQGFLVKSRYFGGLAMSEVAALMHISESTALREWRAAKTWLSTRIRGGPQPT